jgi:CBS domain containing-hemolysin-like protein
MNSLTFTDFLLQLTIFFALLIFAAFLSFVSALYTAIDISKIDLSRINRKKKRIKKFIFVAKNSYFLFVGVCFMSVIMQVVLSSLILDTFRKYFEWKSGSAFYEIIAAFFLALVLEIFVRFLADKEISRKQVTNPLFLAPAYFVTYLMKKILKWLIKPKKSFFYKEEDLIRLMGNLEAENLLEPQEARLLKAAFNFDEETAGKHFKPRKKTIFLSAEMNFKEVKDIYLKYRYTRYPVLSKVEKKGSNLIGIFSFKKFNLKAKNSDFHWLEFVNRNINYLNVDTKLSKAFEIYQETGQHLSVIVDKKGKMIGIITLKDILEPLVGRIRDENDL